MFCRGPLLSDHALQNHARHHIWDSADVLEQESNWLKRRLKEALYIRDEDTTMNLDQGFQLNPI